MKKGQIDVSRIMPLASWGKLRASMRTYLLQNISTSEVLTILSHFAFALAQCTQAIGIRSVGDSMADRRSLVQCLWYPVSCNLEEK